MNCSNPNCGREYKPYLMDEHGLCKMCDMLQSGTPPTIKTEATFQAKGNLGGSNLPPGVRELYLRQARAAGVTTDGRYYEARIAEYPGDPEAWISNQDDMKRVAEQRNYSIEGDVTVKNEKVAPVKGPVIADEIVEDLMEPILEEKLGPDFVTAKGGVVERARDDVLSKHAPPPHIANA